MRRGLTLIEMLVALAVTLVMMAAVVNLFANISASIRNRRAVIEVSGQLRQVRSRLALDLAGATCPGTTWQRPDADVGYIEIIEGERSDADPSELLEDSDGDNRPDGIDFETSMIPSGGDPRVRTPATAGLNWFEGDVTNAGALGDWDDILALTVRSETEPFRDVVDGQMVESPLAEVIWYAFEQPASTPPGPEDGMRRIYRRVLLIAPHLGPWNNRPDNVSVHQETSTGRWIANTLGELTKRENRATREFDPALPASQFPHPLIPSNLPSVPEYIVLSDALAFDVRLYDPGAPLYRTPPPPPSGPDVPHTVLQPGDPGWPAAIAPANLVGYGAYCDLGWAWSGGTLLYPTAALTPGVPVPVFNTPRQVGWHPMLLNAATALRGYPCVYDTWSLHYENDGVPQEQQLIAYYQEVGASPLPQFADWQLNTLDQGLNGLDDEVIPGTPPTIGINGVDDLGERETAPPYDAPLRGIQVSLRIYETDAHQIRQTSVTHAFAK